MFNGIPFECVELTATFNADEVRKLKVGESLEKRPKYERLIITAQLSGQNTVELVYEGRTLALHVVERLTAFGFTVSSLKSRKVDTNPAGKEHYFTVSW